VAKRKRGRRDKLRRPEDSLLLSRSGAVPGPLATGGLRRDSWLRAPGKSDPEHSDVRSLGRTAAKPTLRGIRAQLPEQNRQAFRELAEKRARTELKRADGSYDLDFVRLDLLAFSL